jgi:HD superfamily phosphohydrolase
MHKTVYFHKTTFGIEEACRQLLRRMRDSGRFDIPRDGTAVMELVRSRALAQFTDDYVDRLIHRAVEEGDDVMKALARSIEARRPPKLLKEVQILARDNETDYHAGTFFRMKAKGALRGLAEEVRIPLGQFLLCQTKPLRLEPRGNMVTAEQAQKMPSDREDELVKVFIGAEEEPRSLVDIKYSLIVTLQPSGVDGTGSGGS